MKASRIAPGFLAGTLILSLAWGAGAQTKPDNTKVNQRDRQASQPTADTQRNNRADLDMTQRIRKAIMADKSLSTYAHNIKIITQDSKVTLKGPVRSADEQKILEDKATEIAGVGNVTSEISIANRTTPATRPGPKTNKKEGA